MILSDQVSHDPCADKILYWHTFRKGKLCIQYLRVINAHEREHQRERQVLCCRYVLIIQFNPIQCPLCDKTPKYIKQTT